MSLADLQELSQIQGLVDRGRRLVVLTFAEVAGAVSELDLDEADVEELHGFLEGAAIELVEEVDPALAAAAELERAAEKRVRRSRRRRWIKPDTTDSLQLFMKDVGKVRLLWRRRRSVSRSGSSAVTLTPRRRWSSPTFASSSRSPRTIEIRGCRSWI